MLTQSKLFLGVLSLQMVKLLVYGATIQNMRDILLSTSTTAMQQAEHVSQVVTISGYFS